MVDISLKADWLIVVPKEAGVSITVFDMRVSSDAFKPPKPISLKTAQERVFQAVLQGYSVHKEERDTHTRIYIVSEEEMARKRKVFQKEYFK